MDCAVGSGKPREERGQEITANTEKETHTSGKEYERASPSDNTKDFDSEADHSEVEENG
jgi:hypothetical protein